MKKAIILWGVSGTGKTHARSNDPKLKDLPYIDIADIYRAHPEFDWAEAHIAMRRQVAELLQEHDVIVVEGYFLPESHTRFGLELALRVAGAKPEFREFWAPLETCANRIMEQYERGEISAADCETRLEVLGKCWHRQEALR